MHFKKFYCVSLFLSSMAKTSVCPKSICMFQDCRNKALKTPHICLILHQFNFYVLPICGKEIGDD